MPRELHVPIKSSDTCSLGTAVLVLEGVVFNDVNHRADNDGLIDGYPVQQGLQPAWKTSGQSQSEVVLELARRLVI